MAANPILDQQIIDDPHMKPLEWHKERQNYIGASEVGAILGLNPWKSRLDVYLEKVAEEPVIIDMNERMRWGLIHEAVIASEFCRRTGLKVQQWTKGHQSKKFPFLRASADRLIIGAEGKGTGVLEIKTANGFYANSWSEEVPLMYYAQLQMQMYCSGHNWGAITVLIDGSQLETHWFDRNDDFLAAAVPQLVDFWNNCVMKRIPPSPSNGADVEKLYSEAQAGKVIEVSPEEPAAVAYLDLVNVKAEIKALEKKKTDLEDQVKAVMCDAETLLVGGDARITWKTITTNRLNQKALKDDHPDVVKEYTEESSYRRFLVK